MEAIDAILQEAEQIQRNLNRISSDNGPALKANMADLAECVGHLAALVGKLIKGAMKEELP